MKFSITLFVALFALWACGESDKPALSDRHVVADDVLFLVLGKMSLYDQSAAGELTLRNHHFVAEIMPRAGRKLLSGTLKSSADPQQVLQFAAEGNAFLAHGARLMSPQALHEMHPDGEYVFSFETESGHMDARAVSLQRRQATANMPAAAVVTLQQGGSAAALAAVDPDANLHVGWEPMHGNTRIAASDLDDLVFVLAFDCFGNNVAHSGRPYQGGSYLTYNDTSYTIPAASLEPGLGYVLVIEQATADAEVVRGVPAIATYATLTFVKFNTSGDSESATCPAQIP